MQLKIDYRLGRLKRIIINESKQIDELDSSGVGTAQRSHSLG
jgi:hypothetical protein